VYTAFAGLSRNKARVVHGILSGVWVCLSIAGLGIIEQVKQETGKPRYHSYPLSSPCKQVHHTSLTPVLRVCVCGGRVSCRVVCRVHGRLGLAVMFFSLIQGVAGTLKLFVLFKNNQVRVLCDHACFRFVVSVV
jgi:hypothetical protein